MDGSSYLSEKVLISIRQIIRAIDLHSRYLAKSYGLTGPQLLILRELAENNEVTVGKIAKKISLSQATVTNVLDRLAKYRYVERTRSVHDKRMVNVRITEVGRNKLRDNPSLLQEFFIREFEKLAEWEQTLILSSLQRVASMMKAEGIEAFPVLASGSIALSADDIIDFVDTSSNTEGESNKVT
jgi:DNA-binding MarR family transcriptional regulator